MVKYRDVIDIIEEPSDSEEEEEEAVEEEEEQVYEREVYQEPDGPGSELWEVREEEEEAEDCGVEERNWHQQENEYFQGRHQQENDFFQGRHRPISPAASTLSHVSRSSGWSLSSSASSHRSNSSILAAGRYISGNMRNFFMRIFSSVVGSKRRGRGNSGPDTDTSGSQSMDASQSFELSRPGSPCHAQQRFALVPSRPRSPESNVLGRSTSPTGSSASSVRFAVASRSRSPSNNSSQRFPINTGGAPVSDSHQFDTVGGRTDRLQSDAEQPDVPPNASFRSKGSSRLPPSLKSSSSRKLLGNGSRSQSPQRSSEPGLDQQAHQGGADDSRAGSPQSTHRSEDSRSATPALSTSSNVQSFSGSQRSLTTTNSNAGSQRRLFGGPSQRNLTGSANSSRNLLGSSRSLLSSNRSFKGDPVRPGGKKIDHKSQRKYVSQTVAPEEDAFQDIDVDCSGKISFEEFRRSRMAAAMSDTEARRAFGAIDNDGSGSIDAAEWRAWSKFKAERALRQKLVKNDMVMEDLGAM